MHTRLFAVCTMHMKRILTFAISTLLILGLCACGSASESDIIVATPEPIPSVTEAPTPAATPEPTPVPTPGPDEVSKLSGIPFSEFTEGMNQEYTPVAVMIENSPAARPQYGLQLANIVYEAPVESSITRFMAIFNDVLPERVEPVRSARIYFIKSQQPYDCAFVHYGGPSDAGYDSYIYDEDSEHIRIRVDGIRGKWAEYFVRDDGRDAPHNVICDLTKVVQLYDYQPEPIPFLYSYDEGSTYEGQTIRQIALPFMAGDDFVTYSYDAQTNLLTRSMQGKLFMSAETGEALTVQNLIVQYVNVYSKNELAGRRLMDLVGSGAAAFVIDGVYIEGTWSRESYDAPTKYYAADGSEIVLTPGNTWIALHPDTKDVVVTY